MIFDDTTIRFYEMPVEPPSLWVVYLPKITYRHVSKKIQ
jgi:hypothetical protein